MEGLPIDVGISADLVADTTTIGIAPVGGGGGTKVCTEPAGKLAGGMFDLSAQSSLPDVEDKRDFWEAAGSPFLKQCKSEPSQLF